MMHIIKYQGGYALVSENLAQVYALFPTIQEAKDYRRNCIKLHGSDKV